MKAKFLCGASQFEVELKNHEVVAYHCLMSRPQT